MVELANAQPRFNQNDNVENTSKNGNPAENPRNKNREHPRVRINRLAPRAKLGFTAVQR